VGVRPGQGTFVRRTLAGGSPAVQARLRGELDRWLRTAITAGLDQEGIEALYRAALRDSFLGREEIA
jgi:GntR family transcriptional regulator